MPFFAHSTSDPPGDQSNPYPLSAPAPGYVVIQSPRTMHVEVPFSNFGDTIVIMDRYGNITIKVEQNEGQS